MPELSLIITILAGIAALLFGRQLFWLFVGVLGFLVSFNLATQYLTGQPEWVVLLIALVVGLIGALLAVFLQYVAAGIAGFLAGGYALSTLLNLLNLPFTQDWLQWVVFIIGGVLGAVLVLLVFDWTLIILSAATGAATLANLFTLSPPVLNALLFLVLLVIGIAFQAYMLPRTQPIRTRRTVRRVRRS